MYSGAGCCSTYTIYRIWKNRLKAVNIILMIPGIFILNGCIVPEPPVEPKPKINWDNVQSISNAISVEHNTQYKTTRIRGPNSASDILDTVMLRAWKSEQHNEITYQIYLVDYYHGDWHLYNKAEDAEGNHLSITLNSRDISSCDYATCSHYEHLVMDVSRKYLENNKMNGLVIRISGSGGEENFFISPAYIQAFLSVTK